MKKSAPKYGFGTSVREKDYLGLAKKQKIKTPGPGSYKIPVHVAKTASFVALKRDE